MTDLLVVGSGLFGLTVAERMAEDTPLDGEVELDESYFGGRRRERRAVVPAARSSSLACSSEAGGCMP